MKHIYFIGICKVAMNALTKVKKKHVLYLLLAILIMVPIVLTTKRVVEWQSAEVSMEKASVEKGNFVCRYKVDSGAYDYKSCTTKEIINSWFLLFIIFTVFLYAASIVLPFEYPIVAYILAAILVLYVLYRQVTIKNRSASNKNNTPSV